MISLRFPAVAAWLLAAAMNLPAAEPIRLHPRNPHYFEWRGRALALVTSAEHCFDSGIRSGGSASG